MKKAGLFLAVALLLSLLSFPAFAAQDELGDAAAKTGERLFSLVDGETMETLYRAHFDDADESSTGIMKEWIAELLHGDYDDDDDFDD